MKFLTLMNSITTATTLFLLIAIKSTEGKPETLTESVAQCANSKIEMYGAGSILPAPFLKEVGPAYTANRSFYGRKVSFRYTKLNSNYGKDRILGKIKGEDPVLFACSELLLSQEESGMNRMLKTFPVVAGAMVIMFNLPNIDDVVIDTNDLPKIFMGHITYWDDPALQRINPLVTLPHEIIRTVVRGDIDADTEIFTTAMTKLNPEWAKTLGRFDGPGFEGGVCCNSSNWPDHVEFFGNTVIGTLGVVASIRYTIGYGQLSDYSGVGIKVAALINTMGVVVKPTTEAIQAAMNYHLQRSYGSVAFDLNDAKDPDAYPLCAFSYFFINLSTTEGISCCQMEELAGFLDWVMFDSWSNAAAKRNNLVKLSENIANEVLRGTLRAMTCQGINVYDTYKETLIPDDQLKTYQLGLIVGFGTLFVVGILIGIFCVHQKIASMGDESLWFIQSGEIKVIDAETQSKSGRTSSSSVTPSNRSDPLSPGGSDNQLKYLMSFGTYDDHEVMMNKLSTGVPKSWNGNTRRETLWLRNTILHANILTMLGVTVMDNVVYTVYESAAKGTLHELVRTTKIDVVDAIKFNFALGISDALRFLHKKNIIHGLLSSLTCYVTRSWGVKVALWEYTQIHLRDDKKRLDVHFKHREPKDPESLIKMLYIDPDISVNNLKPSVDVYPFGLLLIEIFTLKLPFRQNVEELSNDNSTFGYVDIIREKFFTKGKLLPRMPKKMPTLVTDIVYQCIGESKNRPEFGEISERVALLNPTNQGIVEVMMDQMQYYTKNLEKTRKELKKLTGKMKDLLHEILPPQIADKLYRGETVPPEFFECATVCFSDIVGFTAISSQSSPQDVMSFLNDLWVMFDKIVGHYDAYKVDTIGDAYMVCSGLPEKNGNEHVREIAMLSFELMEKCDTFKIKHMIDRKLKIRLGFNSGAVMTGVVGTKMPQYCIFGEAVITASKMESTSQPMRIQIAQQSRDLLETHYPEFDIELRGEMEGEFAGDIKTIRTYWLKAHNPAKKSKKYVD